ncbi:hypothetical protein CBR_g38212 [Chara braunii]|uniref:Reverse transcriptase domain-containing protein n=1 Tax=Chara braunii TaxID=69332 RepID=A0A388LPN7_CHABU|nr:hypothetical protein CBR_g38212 [Chara braunii]|eukprot:GBG84241.1 hypothetical protein CBR_g38212 [Chara braunii]
MVDVTDLLHYDPPCPDAELIPLELDHPSISMAPISTFVPPPFVESTPPSGADSDAEELTRYTADLEPVVRNLIREYHDVFPSSFSYAGIPPMRDVEHSIQLVPDYRVHHQAPYRLSIPEATELKRQLEELLRQGFIKPSNSPWGAPVLFARKADETLCLCIDYRDLNRYTVKNSYPMPRSDELFDRLAGNRFFTKIDLRSGYHQIRVTAADQPKTAFQSRFGHYEFTVMPFGLTNAPATFQRAMNDIFRDILEQYVLVYLDDILVYSRSIEEHLKHLHDVLDRLRRHGFYAKLSKCRFARQKVDFLGHYVSDQGLHMDDAKITAIAETLAEFHDQAAAGHMDFHKTLDRVSRLYVWPKRKDFVKDYVAECPTYQEVNSANHLPYGLLQPLPIPEGHWQSISMDFIGPLRPPTPRGHDLILVVVDRFTKRARFVPCRHVINALKVTWTQTSEHPAWIENPKLLIIQAWRTNVEGDLLGFLFGSEQSGWRQLIAQELIVPIVQLADDLSPDIYSESDDNPAPYILERSLDPYLQWTACLEELRDEDTLPSRQEYLKSYDIIPHAFYPKAEEVVVNDDEEDNDEETSEEGSYSEYSEGELSEEEKEEEGEEGTESEWEALPEEAARTGMEAEDPEATRKREEIAIRKRQLEFASRASLRISNDPTRDPEPPNPEVGDLAATTSSTARLRRSRSPSSSSPTRPLVRPRTDAGDRPSSSDAIPPTP